LGGRDDFAGGPLLAPVADFAEEDSIFGGKFFRCGPDDERFDVLFDAKLESVHRRLGFQFTKELLSRLF
nr:hypothetical protein [Tanacetum cinerariifolium]